jgi:hypothetical protein
VNLEYKEEAYLPAAGRHMTQDKQIYADYIREKKLSRENLSRQ